MKISLIQMDAGQDKEANIGKALAFLDEAVEVGTDIVCFPEMFSVYGGDRFEHAEMDADSGTVKRFRDVAREKRVGIVLGSVKVRTDQVGKVTNTSFVINRDGEIICRYDKINMYDVMREDVYVRESDETVSGESIGSFEFDGVKMGVGICFDLRFPNYFQALMQTGAEVIFLPSHFRKATGRIAWDILPNARAIENQSYFCACGQAGGEGAKARCAHTKLVSYDGIVLGELGEEEGVLTVDIDLERLRTFRKEFPVLEQVRSFQ